MSLPIRSSAAAAGCILIATLLLAADPAPPAGPAGAAGGRSKHRLILCNDGGTLGAPDKETPIGVQGFVDETIGPLRGTMVDTLYWQIGTDPYFGTYTDRLSDWYSHDTKVGSKWGAGREQFKTAGEWRIAENERQLEEQGTDSAAVIVKYGHQAGLDVFLSLRIDDGHDNRLPDGLADVNMSPIRHEHPDWLLGNDAVQMEGITGPLVNHSRTAYNFALPQVRQYTFGLVSEAISNYDLDGFDLDFCRQPCLFTKADAAHGGPIITDFLRQVRTALDAKGAAAGRKLYLSVRVPPSLPADRKVGLDVADWIKDGLVDIVVIGDVGGAKYRHPVEDFVAAANGTSCQIVVQSPDGKPEASRSAKVLFREPDTYTAAEERAAAALAWQEGAQGMYFWNHHFIKFAKDDAYDRQPYKEIGDPAVIARKDKVYHLNPTAGDPRFFPDSGAHLAKNETGLPVDFKTVGQNAVLTVEIADDLPSAKRDGVLKEATLRLMIEQLTNLDDLDIRLNGVKMDLKSAKRRQNYNDCWVDFDAADALHQGKNALSITVNGRNPHVGADLLLQDVDTIIKYANGG